MMRLKKVIATTLALALIISNMNLSSMDVFASTTVDNDADTTEELIVEETDGSEIKENTDDSYEIEHENFKKLMDEELERRIAELREEILYGESNEQEEITEEVNVETSVDDSEVVSECISEDISEEEPTEDVTEILSENVSEESDADDSYDEAAKNEMANEVDGTEQSETDLSLYDITEIAIDSTHFPDLMLRKYLSENYDKDSDRKLSNVEIKSIKKSIILNLLHYQL